ncbi:Uncharacterised protein [Bordetella pertussis]|nr:Uncharacterised protein [Bordetella pertussis]CPJ53847.1 Uncharacterised protein [Bordetella pertussis]
MHHQVGVGQAGVDFLDARDRQDVAGGLAGELVGAVAGADGDGQRVELGAAHEIGGLLGVGQQLFHGQLAVGAVAVFLVALHGFQRAQATQFAFDRHAQLVGHVHHFLGDVDVVVVVGDGLAVFFQRAVHHHAGKAQVDGALTNRGRLAVVLVHDDRDVGVRLDGGLDEVFQEAFAGIFAGAGRGLHDHRAVGLGGGFHDGLDLLQVVDVESGNAVAVLGGVVEQLAHGN